MRPSRVPLLAAAASIRFAERAGGVKPCVEVDPDDTLARWACDLGSRSYAERGTVEFGFSVAAGSCLNVGVSLGAGLVDLAVFCVARLWSLFVLASVFLWGLLLAYVAWFPGASEALWLWWYVTVWEGLVVAAWDIFFLLGILAFLVYLVWAILGVPVCIIICLVLVALVPIIFLLVALAVVICFAVFLILTLAVGLISLVALVLLAAIVILLWLVAAAVIALLTLIILSLGWLLAWGLVATVGVGLLAVMSFGVKKRREYLEKKRKSRAPIEDEENGEQGNRKKVRKAIQRALGILATTAATFVAFLVDVQLVFTNYILFERLVAGTPGDSATGSIFPNMHFTIKDASLKVLPILEDVGVTGFADQLGDIVLFIGTWSLWLADTMNWMCPGAAAIFATSQMLVGVVIGFLLRSPDMDIKYELLKLLVDAENSGILAVAASRVAKYSIVKALEITVVGPVFVLMFFPNKNAPCNYEGDVIVAVLAYIVMIVVSVPIIVLAPCIALGSFGNRDGEERLSFCRLVHLWSLLVRAVFGIIHPDIVRMMLAEHMQKHTSLNEYRWSRYLFFSLSIELAALVFQALPLGGAVCKFMTSCNDGFALVVGDGEGDDWLPRPDKLADLAVVQKSMGYLRGSLHVITPVLPLAGKQVVILLALPICFVTVVCNDFKDRADAEKVDLADEHFAPTRLLDGCCAALGRLLFSGLSALCWAQRSFRGCLAEWCNRRCRRPCAALADRCRACAGRMAAHKRSGVDPKAVVPEELVGRPAPEESVGQPVVPPSPASRRVQSSCQG